MGITTLSLQLRTRLLLNTHVQVGTPRMDWVAFPVLNRASNPIYCFLSHLSLITLPSGTCLSVHLEWWGFLLPWKIGSLFSLRKGIQASLNSWQWDHVCFRCRYWTAKGSLSEIRFVIFCLSCLYSKCDGIDPLLKRKISPCLHTLE